MSAAELLGDTFSHEADLYQLTLNLCLILLCVGTVCGCIYEVIRRKRRATKVEPESMNDHFIFYPFFPLYIYPPHSV